MASHAWFTKKKSHSGGVHTKVEGGRPINGGVGRPGPHYCGARKARSTCQGSYGKCWLQVPEVCLIPTSTSKVPNSNFYLLYGDGSCHPRGSSERCLILRRWPQEGGPKRHLGG